jgi:hypothetical protein
MGDDHFRLHAFGPAAVVIAHQNHGIDGVARNSG